MRTSLKEQKTERGTDSQRHEIHNHFFNLQIKDGRNNHRLCHKADEKVILTGNHSVEVVFKTDATVQGKGFSVLWKAGRDICHVRYRTFSVQTVFCTFLSGGYIFV